MLRDATRSLPWLTALALVGCAKPARPARPPAEAPREREVSLEEVVRAQRSASELALVAELLARPKPAERAPANSDFEGPVACEMTSRRPLYQTLGLRLGPGKQPFGVFSNGVLRVVVPASSERVRAVHATSDNGGLVVHGVVDPSELELYLSAATDFGGFVIVGTKTRVALESASLVGLTVRHDLESSSGVTTALRAVRGMVTCRELDLVPGHDEPEDGFNEPIIEGLVLARSRRIPLAAAPGGQVVTTLRVDEPILVGVIEKAGRATRVMIGRSDDVLFGWVPSDALRPADEYLGQGTTRGRGYGVGTGTGVGFSHEGTVKCPVDVPIEVEQFGKRRRAGFVRRGTLMQVEELREDRVAIDVTGSQVSLAYGARLLVERAALDGCKLELPPKLQERSNRPLPWPRTAPKRLE
jgi:hypothetical protein